ncbi:MAG: bile acid:sodium symporter [Bacteriovoracaceae bacterium]|nr:bile acid:sodium symporter [Bacteriovoracaceae bacterium]
MILSIPEQTLLISMIFFLMIGIGCSLEGEKFTNFSKTRKSLLTGLALQYISMPFLALALSHFFNFSPSITLVMLLITCCPGGTTSNMFSYFARANVELSILLTTITTTLAFVMTPVLLKLFGQTLESPIFIPVKQMMLILASILIPIFMGFGIKLKSKSMAIKVERYGSILGTLSIIVMIFIWTPKLFTILKQQDTTLFMAIGATSAIGILIGLVVTKLLKIDNPDIKTIGFENGIQNAPLAFAIISLSFPKAIVEEVGWIPLVYGALSVGVALSYLVLFRIFSFKSKVIS